jgi:hypothetical protein
VKTSNSDFVLCSVFGRPVASILDVIHYARQAVVNNFMKSIDISAVNLMSPNSGFDFRIYRSSSLDPLLQVHCVAPEVDSQTTLRELDNVLEAILIKKTMLPRRDNFVQLGSRLQY